MHEYNARVSKFKINFDKEEGTQKEPEQEPKSIGYAGVQVFTLNGQNFGADEDSSDSNEDELAAPTMQLSKASNKPQIIAPQIGEAEFVTRVYGKSDWESAKKSLINVVQSKLAASQLSGDLYLLRTIDYLTRKSYFRQGFNANLLSKNT